MSFLSRIFCCCAAVPTGACCFDDNCQIRTEQDCLDQEGVYLGDGTVCVPNPCFVTGACCVGEECFIMTQSDCSGGRGLPGRRNGLRSKPLSAAEGCVLRREPCLPQQFHGGHVLRCRRGVASGPGLSRPRLRTNHRGMLRHACTKLYGRPDLR